MRRLLFIFLSATIVLLTGCSVTEEVTLKSDGQLSYRMNFDLTELIKMSPDAADEFSEKNDTIISFADLVREKKSMKDLTEEQKQILKDIEPLKFKYSSGQDESKSMVSIFGDFKSSADLNKVFTSLAKLEESEKSDDDEDQNGKKDPMDNLFKNPMQYSWDGKILKITKAAVAEEDDDIADGSDLLGMFSSGSVKVSYTFPSKVKTVSDSGATFSQDGKSVYFNYSIIEYYNAHNKAKELTIEIE